MNRESGQDPFAGLKSGSEEYSVYDAHYERIGRVDDVFLDELDAVTYIGVEMGFFGTNSTLVPAEIVRVNDRRRLIEVAAEAETIKHAPHFGKEETVSAELEDRVRSTSGSNLFCRQVILTLLRTLAASAPTTGWTPNRARGWRPSTGRAGWRETRWPVGASPRTAGTGRRRRMMLRSTAGGGESGRIRRRRTGRMCGESVRRRNE